VTTKSNAPEGTVVLNGGFETDPVDGGRPVGLIAAALGVKPEVFRKAFDEVRPARGGAPTPARAHANKEKLMAVLGPLGVSNDRLDEVSNYYRYRPESGTLWRHRQAEVKAVILDGEVKSFEITDPGAGYLTAPTVKVEGYPFLQAKAKLAFDKDLAKNGRIENIVIMTDI